MTKNKAANFLDRYIPSHFDQQNDFHSFIRAKILLALYFSTTCIIFMVISFLLLVIPQSNPNWFHGILSSAVAFIILTFQVMVFYKSENIGISALVFSMTFFVLTFITVMVTGGWQSPVLLLFFCSPAVSFLVGGRREGLYITSLVFLCGAMLMVAYEIDFTLYQIIAPENMEYMRFAIWIASVSLLVACLTTYDFLLEHALRNKRKDSRL